MYFVLTREEDDLKESYGGAWGYYSNLEAAVDAVHRNVTDIHETIYPYAIIERLDHGLFPIPKGRYWFGWEEEKNGFYEIEKPDGADAVPDHFSMALGATGNPNFTYTEDDSKNDDDECPNYFVMVADSEELGERVRQCGFFADRDTALKSVQENWGDMYKDKNDIAWIECITPGILAWSTECVWFRWDAEKNGYKKSVAPATFVDWPEPPYYPVSFL